MLEMTAPRAQQRFEALPRWLSIAGLVTLCLACSTPSPKNPSQLTDEQIDSRLNELPKALVSARDWEFVGKCTAIGGGVVAVVSGATALASSMTLGGGPGRDCTVNGVLFLAGGGVWFTGNPIRIGAQIDQKALKQEEASLLEERRERRGSPQTPTAPVGILSVPRGRLIVLRGQF